MALMNFTATAATCEVIPGTEQANNEGILHIQGQIFVDIVESQEAAIAGTNRPRLDIRLNPKSGEGEVQGGFTLTPQAVKGTWEGEMRGRFVNGMVSASGVARGTDALEGAVLRIDFQQIAEYPGEPPCENPQAFFEMSGWILK